MPRAAAQPSMPAKNINWVTMTAGPVRWSGNSPYRCSITRVVNQATAAVDAIHLAR